MMLPVVGKRKLVIHLILFLLIYSGALGQSDSVLFRANKLLYSDPDSVIFLVKSFLDSTAIEYDGRILNTIGAAYFVKGDFDSSFYYYTLDTAFRKPVDLANAYGGIGGVFSAKRLNQQAADYYLKAAQLYQMLDQEQFLAGAYNNIANILVRIGDIPRAKSYYQDAISIHQANNDSSRLLPNYFNLGDLYRISKNYDSATFWATQSSDLSTRLKST